MNDTSPKAVLWPTEQNYGKFRAVCDDILPRTFNEFAVSTPRRRRQAEWRIDADAVKLDFDPDAMAEWCRIYFGKVDATARKFYAAFLLRSGGATLDRP